MKPITTQKIAIFGGSFDPIHLGHLHLAEIVREEFSLCEIIFMPSPQPPHKDLSMHDNRELRYEMVVAATRSNPYFKVSRLEYDRSGYSYTAETLRLLRNELAADAVLYFIVGADSLVNMHKWKDPDKIFALCEIIAIDRVGTSDDEIISAKESLAKNFGAKIHLLKKHTYPISSTEVRERVELGLSIKYFVTDTVVDLIEFNRMCRHNPNLKNIIAHLKAILSPKRYAHSERTAQFATSLAKVHGEDADKAYLAGLVHDVAKELTPTESAKYNHVLAETDLLFSPVIHSFLGAEMAKDIFDINDTDILNAIRYHTTARLKMSVLEKVIFVADKIEDGRDYPENSYLKELAESDLDKAVLEILKITTSIAEDKGYEIHPLSLEVLRATKN